MIPGQRGEVQKGTENREGVKMRTKRPWHVLVGLVEMLVAPPMVNKPAERSHRRRAGLAGENCSFDHKSSMYQLNGPEKVASTP